MQVKTLNVAYDVAFEASKHAIKELGITIASADKQKKTITGTTKTSFLSWGENIQINFEVINTSATKIEVESTSQAQLISWGKNSDNEKEVIDAISKLLLKK